MFTLNKKKYVDNLETISRIISNEQQFSCSRGSKIAAFIPAIEALDTRSSVVEGFFLDI